MAWWWKWRRKLLRSWTNCRRRPKRLPRRVPCVRCGWRRARETGRRTARRRFRDQRDPVDRRDADLADVFRAHRYVRSALATEGHAAAGQRERRTLKQRVAQPDDRPRRTLF